MTTRKNYLERRYSKSIHLCSLKEKEIAGKRIAGPSNCISRNYIIPPSQFHRKRETPFKMVVGHFQTSVFFLYFFHGAYPFIRKWRYNRMRRNSAVYKGKFSSFFEAFILSNMAKMISSVLFFVSEIPFIMVYIFLTFRSFAPTSYSI